MRTLAITIVMLAAAACTSSHKRDCERLADQANSDLASVRDEGAAILAADRDAPPTEAIVDACERTDLWLLDEHDFSLAVAPTADHPGVNAALQWLLQDLPFKCRRNPDEIEPTPDCYHHCIDGFRSLAAEVEVARRAAAEEGVELTSLYATGSDAGR